MNRIQRQEDDKQRGLPGIVRMKEVIIAPSLLSCDFAELGNEAERMLQAGAQWLHVDVMDGHFVPNLTVGPVVVKSLCRRLPEAYLDCHLMVTDPVLWIEPLARAGASSMTVHVEVFDLLESLTRCISLIRSAGMRVGLAIKPSTNLEESFLMKPGVVQSVDFVLVMTVEPGFGGQPLIGSMVDRVRHLKDCFADLQIEVDGGVTGDNSSMLIEAGARVLVMGTALFDSANPRDLIARIVQL